MTNPDENACPKSKFPLVGADIARDLITRKTGFRPDAAVSLLFRWIKNGRVRAYKGSSDFDYDSWDRSAAARKAFFNLEPFDGNLNDNEEVALAGIRVDVEQLNRALSTDWLATEAEPDRTASVSLEKEVSQALEDEIANWPDGSPWPRQQWTDHALARWPRLTRNSFDRAWDAAVSSTGGAWRRGGRKPTPSTEHPWVRFSQPTKNKRQKS